MIEINQQKPPIELVSQYFGEKLESYRWLISQLKENLTQIENKANETVYREQQNLLQSLHGLNPQQVLLHISELRKNRNQHLVQILEQINLSIKNLSEVLIRKLRPYESHCSPKPVSKQGAHLIPKNTPIQTSPHSLNMPGQYKIEIKIPSKAVPAITFTNPTSIGQRIPVIHSPEPVVIRGKMQDNNSKSKAVESPSLSTLNEVAEFCAIHQEDHQSQFHKVSQEQIKDEVCAEGCLELDDKIFSEANDYLIKIKSKIKGGFSANNSPHRH